MNSQNDSRSVLVTGANGFVGKNLISSLERTRPVNCLVRDPRFHPQKATIYRFSYYKDSVVEKAVSRSNSIVHCAALLHGRKKDMWRANVHYTERLLHLAKRHHISHFIFLSTENVQHPLTDIYTITKKYAENKVARFKYHSIFRPTVLYGPNDRKYLTRLIQILKNWPVAPVLGNGDNRFQFLYIHDLLQIIISSLDRNIYGTYTLAGPESVTYIHLVRQILKLLGLEKPLVKLPIPFLKPLSYTMEIFLSDPPITHSQLENLKIDRNYNIQKNIRFFNYKPTSLEEGLKKLISGYN